MKTFSPQLLCRGLLAWYRVHRREMPWRGHPDPYAVWVSEIMLQQTRVDTVRPYFARFVARFPSPASLAAADDDALLKHWEGLGYYGRARHLRQAAREVVARHGGELPRSVAALTALPGIGPYTAAAVASIAFGERVAVLDGNVKRVLARLFALDDCIDDPATERELWRLAQTLVPPRGPGDFNQAMMELGARVCTPRAPACMACPVASECRAHAEGREAELPVRKPKAATPLHEIVTAVIERDGCFLVGRRPHGGMLGGLWEFPGGKVEKGEDHALALARECREELGVEVCAGGLVACVRHAYTHFRIVMSVYRCAITAGEPAALAHTELRWVSPEAFDTLAFPKANHKFLPLLRGDAEQEGPCSRGVSK